MTGPLNGIRVLEVGHTLAGPYCGLLLADLGADVIKIEPPGGEIARRVSPHFIGEHNTYFASLNRNKRSVVLDLASSQGQHALHELVRSAHALITNFRPSAIRKLGLTYDALRTVNPHIVCVALTGFGLESPFGDRPAYDYIIQAMTGIMELTGDHNGPPTKVGYSAVDNSAGIMGALGLLAKIVEGNGGQVDIAMFDVMLSQLNYVASAALNAGEHPSRLTGSAHPYFVPAQVFATVDGWVALFITHDDFWRSFSQAVGRPDWVSDERFATMDARRQNRELVVSSVGKVLANRKAEEWVRCLVPLGVVAAEVATLDDALASEHASARSMIVEIETAGGKMRLVGNPVKFGNTEEDHKPPPQLGEHNDLISSPNEINDAPVREGHR